VTSLGTNITINSTHRYDIRRNSNNSNMMSSSMKTGLTTLDHIYNCYDDFNNWLMNSIRSGSIIRLKYAYEKMLSMTGDKMPMHEFKKTIVSHNNNKIKLYMRPRKGTFITMSTPEQYANLLINSSSDGEDLDQQKFFDSVPVLVQNFISLCTLSINDYENFKTNDLDLFDFNTLFFKNYHKVLKISSICLDLMYCRNDDYITHKHVLLAMTILRLSGSIYLIRILNRFGITSYIETIERLKTEAAEEASSPDELPKDIEPNNFVIKVVDNCDLNTKSTLDGTGSLHYVNTLFIQYIGQPKTENNDDYNEDNDDEKQEQNRPRKRKFKVRKIINNSTSVSIQQITNVTRSQNTRSTFDVKTIVTTSCTTYLAKHRFL
ncbi:unnamed protein product, partial [Didymodactylos carnosus]